MSPDPRTGTEVPQEAQRKNIAWCGRCGNVSLDGLNFERAGGKVGDTTLECLACGAVSDEFEYIQRARLSALPDAFKEKFPEEAFPALYAVLRHDVLRWLEEQTRG